MSSTNRGTERERDDFYETPAWCTRAILDAVPCLAEGPILDPCAGRGAILLAWRELRLAMASLDRIARSGGRLTYSNAKRFPVDEGGRGIEVNPDRAGECRRHYPCVLANALDTDWRAWPELRGRHVVMNPPYIAALEFCEKAISFCEEEQTVCAALLRLNFLGSAKRRGFHNRKQSDLYVLSRRPSFTGHGTDSIEYAWYVWYPKDPTMVRPIPGPSFGKVTVL